MCTFTRALFHKTVNQTFLITFLHPVKYVRGSDHQLFIPVFSLSLARKHPVRLVSGAIFNASAAFLLQDSAKFRFHQFGGRDGDEDRELDLPPEPVPVTTVLAG